VYEWHIKYSENNSFGIREVIAYAYTEDEAKKILSEEMPMAEIESIRQGDKVEGQPISHGTPTPLLAGGPSVK
jgi:hypothetical protein